MFAKNFVSFREPVKNSFRIGIITLFIPSAGYLHRRKKKSPWFFLLFVAFSLFTRRLHKFTFFTDSLKSPFPRSNAILLLLPRKEQRKIRSFFCSSSLSSDIFMELNSSPSIFYSCLRKSFYMFLEGGKCNKKFCVAEEFLFYMCKKCVFVHYPSFFSLSPKQKQGKKLEEKKVLLTSFLFFAPESGIS